MIAQRRNGSAEFDINPRSKNMTNKQAADNAFTISDEDLAGNRSSMNQSDYSLLKSLVDKFAPQEQRSQNISIDNFSSKGK